MPKRDLAAIAQGSSADLLPLQRGRGLTGLLSARSGVVLDNARRLPLDVIDINHQQSRQSFDETTLAELAESIRQHDVLQPIGVRRNGERYEILFGERRYRAASMAGKVDIPAVIYEDLAESDAAIITALENLQREDLDIEDEARQFALLLEKTGMSQRALARKLGIDHRYVLRRVKLLERPDLMQAYREGRMKLHDAVAMVDLPPEELDASEFADGGPRGTSFVDDGGAEDLDLVEREDLPGYIVTRNQHSSSSTQSGPRGTSAGGRTRFRWRPVQQFYSWVGRTQVADVPPEERVSLKVQLTEIKEALEKQIEQLEKLQADGQSEDTAARTEAEETA